MFENKIAEKVMLVYFTALSFMMYYFINEDAYIAGVGFSYRHLFAIGIFVSAFIVFIIKPDMARGSVAVKSSLVYAAPMLVVITVSLLVWFIDQSDTATIFRGISTVFFHSSWLACALGAGAMLYIFGEKGIWVNLVAILGANLLMIGQIIAENGAGPFFSEFATLLRTFASETGEIIMKAEIHELAFCLGAYIIYMLYKPKKNVGFWILFALTVFCFLTAFKRIAFVGIMLALLVRFIIWITAHISKRAICKSANIIMIVACVLLLAYIFVIKAGTFEMLEKAGFDTTGRAQVYKGVSQFYEVTPSFAGHGIGFLTYQLYTNHIVGISTVHNDFLQFYIDLGFFGYILWLVSMSYMRTKYYGRREDSESATVACMLIAYLFGVSMTDNTINYPLLIQVIGLLMMGHTFNSQVEYEKNRIEAKWKQRIEL